jgi:hypothetical protein
MMLQKNTARSLAGDPAPRSTATFRTQPACCRFSLGSPGRLRYAERVRRLGLAAVVIALSCTRAPPLPPSPPTPATYFVAERTDATFYTADHFLASIEMQISGEPLAQLLGRSLGGYDRFNRTPDLYTDPQSGRRMRDPLSYSLAIESYEYSKQPMNNTSFESGAGLSLMFGPLLNPDGKSGDAAVALLRARVQQLALESSAGGPAGTNFVVSPAPVDNPFNVYGWPGFWPAFAEFGAWDTHIAPTSGGQRYFCSFVAGYGALAAGAQIVGDYECSYNSLNLPDRTAQVQPTLLPDALGYATWKQSLWIINYWRRAATPTATPSSTSPTPIWATSASRTTWSSAARPTRPIRPAYAPSTASLAFTSATTRSRDFKVRP